VTETVLAVSNGVWVATAHRGAASRCPCDIAATADSAPWRRRQRLAARGLLRSLLTRLAPETAGADLVASVNGKPVLVGFPSIGVSVSHDGGVVAVAVGLGHEVGVDVVLPRCPPSERMIRRCLRDRAPELDGLPMAERAIEFAWVWSVQEACVKADGTGVGGKPWTIDIPLRPRAGRARDLTWVALRGRTDVPVSCAFSGPMHSASRPATPITPIIPPAGPRN
jgi:4'-phosphopantetheinyl transferase